MSVVIEVIHQFVQSNNFQPYVITQLSHIHIHMHTLIRLREKLPLLRSSLNNSVTRNETAWLI